MGPVSDLLGERFDRDFTRAPMTLLTRLSSGWKAYVLLAFLTFSAAVPGVFYVPALDRDESRFAQASKQMLETGELIEIRYQDEARNKKPAGIHWLQAGATAAFSTPQAGQIWSYRLPSLLGAMLATLLTFWCGVGLIGRRGAFLGAALFGAGLLLTSEAHIAKTDAVLVGLTVLAMGALARLYEDQAGDKRRYMYLLWAALGLSFLIKGPVSVLVVGLAVAVIGVVERRFRLGKLVLDWRGFALFGVIVLPWFIAVQLATDGAFLEGAVGKDLKDKVAGASEGHGGPIGYHFVFSLLMFFPATFILVPSIVLLVRTLRGRALEAVASQRAGLWFLMAWFLPTWIFFELLPTKLSHYILPAYPALALMCGWGVVQMMGQARLKWARYGSLFLFAIGGAALCFVASPFGVELLQEEAAEDFRRAAGARDVLEAWARQPDMGLHLLLAGCGAILLAAGLGAARKLGAGVTVAIGASLLIGWHVRLVFLPGATWLQPTQTARIALAEVCGLQIDRAPLLYAKTCHAPYPERVQAVGYAEPSLVLTVGTNTVLPPKTLVSLPEDGAGYPIVFLLNIEDEAGAAAHDELTKRARELGREVSSSKPHYALNYSNGDPVAFIAMRIN